MAPGLFGLALVASFLVRVDVRVPDARVVMNSPSAASSRTRASSWCSDRSATAQKRRALGRSESAYNVRDLDFTLPVLELRRCRAWASSEAWARLVVAPYATALAAMIDRSRRPGLSALVAVDPRTLRSTRP